MKKLVSWISVIISAFLSAVVLIFSLVFGCFTNADTADANGFYHTKLEPIIEKPVSLIFVILIFLILITIIEFFKVSLREENSRLKEEVKEYRQLTKDKSLDILINLKDMQRIHKKDKLLDFITKYTIRNPYVMAVQIYQFSFKHTLIQTRYKVNYFDGFVRDGEEVNAISQIFYEVNRKTTKQFSDAYMEFASKSNHKKLKAFVTNNLKELNSKSIDKINEEDCIIYSLVIYSMQVLAEDGEEIVSTINDTDKEDLLNNKKRTGILRGIIHSDFYKFNYTGNDDNKKDRLYVTFCKEINGVDFLFLITFSPEINTNNQEEEEFIRSSVIEFQERSSEFDNMI